MNIGFIGLGNMGSGMASNLLEFCKTNDHQLIVYDVNTDVVASFVQKGASAAENHTELCKQVEVLFTSLPSSKQINQLALGDNGILQQLAAGAVWFETSTNDLSEWQNLVQQAPASITLVDAPVTGGAEGAAAGTLTMLLGIEQTVLSEHSELLASCTSNAVLMGPSGAGYVAKLCQLHLNYLLADGIGEALMLGAKADINLQTLQQVLHTSCAQSYVVDSYIPKVLDGSYDPSFTLGLAAKDMRLISELGRHLEVPLNLADEVCAHYLTAEQEYGSDSPHLKIVKLIEDKLEVSFSQQ
ncbi:MAG: 3-hydroxyisobutyrate dehydrogenase-like beta-hydroxyacid dehydrogenase [Dinoroseobacter sp.]|jgi:3-hydroxyisobutyrate dehydrogenase-like beta-hydroxyacid dehydrogenase